MSGIYIQNMEMPTGKVATIEIHPDGSVFTLRGRGIGNAVPVEEIPPHGRLIDADAFFKDICDSLNEMTAIGLAVDGEWMWGKLNDALRNAPTVIEAEEGEKNV